MQLNSFKHKTRPMSKYFDQNELKKQIAKIRIKPFEEQTQ